MRVLDDQGGQHRGQVLPVVSDDVLGGEVASQLGMQSVGALDHFFQRYEGSHGDFEQVMRANRHFVGKLSTDRSSRRLVSGRARGLARAMTP